MRAAAYCRVSTDSDEQLESLENQKLFFGDFASKNNLRLVKIYADEGISGKQMKNRAEFLRMLSDAKLGAFDMVVVKDISRFARNTVDFLTSIRELKSMGIDVKFLSNNQTILGDSEFILTIFSAMAQEESANLSRRVKFGKKINAQKGRVPARVYGYNRVDNFTLAPDEYESAIVKKIFDMYVNRGYGAGRIAKELYAGGVPSKITKSPASWNSKTVRRILTNSIYVGKYINNRYEVTDYLTGKRGTLPEHQHLHHSRPEFRIIPDGLFDAAQEKMRRNQKIYKNEHTHVTGRESSRHIFSTLIRCNHCGRAYSRRSYTYKNKRTFWVCAGFNIRGSDFCDNRTKIEEEDMLEAIGEYLRNTINNQEPFVQALISEISERYSKAAGHFDPEKSGKQIKKLETDKEKYKTMYLNGIIDIDELKSSAGKLDERISRLKNGLAGLNGMNNRPGALKSEDLYLEIKSILNMRLWTNADLKRVIDKISADKTGEINIYLREL
ncbi:MAG: recombinase family protein [Oscillospiraceae bacterium]|nr:recombinase family protein [Oscillospiraceae bacterium]